MKTESLTNGAGISDAPKSYYFNEVTFRVFSSGRDSVTLVGKKESREVITVRIHLDRKTFYVKRVKDIRLSTEHLYAIERLLQSYALTFNFSILQLLLPLNGALSHKNEVEYSGELEVFPSFSS